MRVVKYNTRLNEDRLPMLIKESSFNYNNKTVVSNCSDVVKLLRETEDIYNLDTEQVFVFCFNTRMKLIGYYILSKGGISQSLVPIRDIFIKALAIGASNIILVHNHPSGDYSPSKEDIQVTERIRKAGELLEIYLLDHIIIGDKDYCSLKEYGIV